MTNPVTDLRRKLEKRFKDSTEVFPDFTAIKQIATSPSGSAIIDAVTGIGGYPRGRVTEIFGGYSTGKTTLAIHSGAAEQKKNPNAVILYLDYEHAFDASYAHALGLNLSPDKFVFCQPDHFEQGDLVMDAYAQEGLVDMIVVDSAAAMTPQEDLEGKVDSTGRIGLQAQLMARMLARLTKKISKGRKPALLIINQTRTKIDLKNPRGTGEDAAGGHALKFYASLRIKLENITGDGDSARGSGVTDQVYTRNRVRVTCIKNKLAPPFRRGQLTIDYGKGVNNIVSVAELAEQKLGIMSGAGFFAYQGLTPETSFSCRGRDQFQQLLLGNAKLAAELEKKVLAALAAEQASSLGVEVLSTNEAAKEIEDTDGVVLLSDAAGALPVEDVR